MHRVRSERGSRGIVQRVYDVIRHGRAGPQVFEVHQRSLQFAQRFHLGLRSVEHITHDHVGRKFAQGGKLALLRYQAEAVEATADQLCGEVIFGAHHEVDVVVDQPVRKSEGPVGVAQAGLAVSDNAEYDAAPTQRFLDQPPVEVVVDVQRLGFVQFDHRHPITKSRTA